MKQLLGIYSLLFLMSCSSKIDEHFITEHESELQSIVQESLKSNIDTLDAKGDHEISKRLKDLGVERLEIKYKAHSYDFISADSLIYFSIEDGNLWEPTKYLVYDFSKTPRKFGNIYLIGASYDRKQISDRWYYETIGFD